jgi:hypothetical protein
MGTHDRAMGEDVDWDCQQRAKVAMRKAAAAACAAERHEWVQAALLWQLLGHASASETTIAPAQVSTSLIAELPQGSST